MGPVSTVPCESELLHRSVGLACEPGLNEVKVVGLVSIIGIDRDNAASGEDNSDAMALQSGAHERRERLKRERRVDLIQSGFPVRRGRLRRVKYRRRSLSGRVLNAFWSKARSWSRKAKRGFQKKRRVRPLS